MASGNEGDSPRAQGRRGSLERRMNSEDSVVEQAEEVFRSYAYHCYQQELQERGAELLRDPEIEQIQPDLDSIISRVGQRLAIIGDDICRRYEADFRTMLESLQPTCNNAYELFTRVASK